MEYNLDDLLNSLLLSVSNGVAAVPEFHPRRDDAMVRLKAMYDAETYDIQPCLIDDSEAQQVYVAGYWIVMVDNDLATKAVAIYGDENVVPVYCPLDNGNTLPIAVFIFS